jgi:hypothetical protein
MKHILVYGILAGAVTIGSGVLAISLAGDGHFGPAWLGYLIMILTMSLVFVGIKRYRDQELGGVVRFGTAFLVGLGITLLASAIYVAVWEAYLAATDYAFMAEYARAQVAEIREQGVSGAALQEEIQAMDRLVERYDNPLFRLPITFLEIFPVGLLITLVSAALLRNSRVLPAT